MHSPTPSMPLSVRMRTMTERYSRKTTPATSPARGMLIGAAISCFIGTASAMASTSAIFMAASRRRRGQPRAARAISSVFFAPGRP